MLILILNRSQSYKGKLLFKNIEGHHLVYDMSHLVDDSVSIQDYKLPTSKRSRRKVIKDRTSRDITNFNAWRVIDRQLLVPEPYKSPISKLSVSPADLIHCFGEPHRYMAKRCSGFYMFEDNNMDMYVLAEPNLTTYGRGFNKSDEYYEEQKKIHISKRVKKYPTVEEFWESKQTYDFFLYCTPYAEYRKFKIFLKQQIEELLKQQSFEVKMEPKYGEIFNSFDNFDADYTKYTERDVSLVPVFNYIWADYLDEDERKKMKNEIPDIPKPPELVE